MQTQCKGILKLSYKHLPDHLKPCFLYFGAFQEDEKVPAQKLMWLWIAEGFIWIAVGFMWIPEGFIQKACLKSLVVDS